MAKNTASGSFNFTFIFGQSTAEPWRLHPCNLLLESVNYTEQRFVRFGPSLNLSVVLAKKKRNFLCLALK
jgi:hypothetical protein